jgi:hypothetical protein
LAVAIQVALTAVLACMALLCAGLGGNVGVVSQTLAGKLAASVQFLQRHGGTSLASRVVRRDIPAVAADLRVAEAPRAVAQPPGEGVVPPDALALPVALLDAVAKPGPASQPVHSPSRLSPPSRAPPLRA